MSIDARTEGGLGIVEMKRSQSLQANGAVESAKHFPNSGLAPDVIACGEDVSGVQTNAKAFRLGHVLNEIGDLLESVAETGTLSGRRFQGDARFNLRNFPQHAIDRSGNGVEPGFFPCAEVGSRMQDQERQFKLVGAR